MERRTKNRETGRKRWRNRIALFLAAIVAAALLQPLQVWAAGTGCKELCMAALKAAGGAENLKYQSEHADDFGGFSASDREKVSSIMYVCDEKEAYSLCVARASSKSGAADLLKSLKAYKSNNSNSGYLSDYSKTEQKVFKNAICGKKGKYVWYIAMSTGKSANKKGQTALKKKL